jgi:AcrR family transcriptional regulator
VATGTVYKNFSGKAELMTAVFRDVVGREVAAVAAAQRSGTAVERVTAAVETFAGRALKNPTLAAVLLAEPVDTAVDVERLRFRRVFAETFEYAIAEGVADGQLPPQNPCTSAAALVGAIGEVLVGPLARAPQAESVVSELVAFALRALGIHEQQT